MTVDSSRVGSGVQGRRRWGPVAAIMLLAFGLRAFHLGTQSIWYDEGLSILYAQQSLPGLFALVGGSEHPPFYFLLLWLWVRLAGPVTPAGEFIVRFPSLLWGVLAVVLAWRLGCDLLDRRGDKRSRTALSSKWPSEKEAHDRLSAANLGALLLGVSPFHVWYSQETRMYTQAAALSLLAGVLLLRALETGRRRLWLVYALTTAAGLYTHLYTLFAIAFQAAYVAWWAYRWRSLRTPVLWGLCQVAVMVAFIPWGWLALQQLQFNDTYWRGTVRMESVLVSMARAFVVGETWTGWPVPILAAMYLALAVVGVTALAAAARRSSRADAANALAFLLPFVIVPVAGVLLVTLTRPKFAPRYLLPVTPALALLVAQGLAVLAGEDGLASRPSRLGAGRLMVAGGLLAALLAGSGLGLWGLYFDPDQARPDFRAVAGYVRAHAEPDDAVIIVAGHAYPAYRFYDAEHPAYPMPPRLLPTVSQPLDRLTVAETLNRAVQDRHRRLWLVLWQEELADPRRLVITQLLNNARRLPVGQVFHDVSLLLFELDPETPFSPQPAIQHPLSRNFGDELDLLGYDLDRRQLRCCEALNLRLYWRARRPLSANYTAFTHLINQADHIYGQHDRRLGGDFFPTSLWPPGEIVAESYAIRVEPGTPPGRYLLEVGAYLPDTGRRLPLVDDEGTPEGDRLILAEIVVERGNLPATEMNMEALAEPVAFGPLRLIGYRLLENAVAPGGVLHLALYWQADGPGDPDSQVHLRLLDEGEHVLHEHVAPPVDGLYPPDRWSAGEIVRDVHRMLVPAGTAPGRYRVAVRLGESGSFVALPIPVQVR